MQVPELGREAFYAHTHGESESEWELLEDHLRGVASRAEAFAGAFGSSDWGRLAGLWHDLGKYHPGFQQRLRDESIRQPHAGAGAALAMQRDPRLGLFLAFAIAGHHAGLANWKSSEGVEQAPLEERLRRARKDELEGALPGAPREIAAAQVPALPAALERACRAAGKESPLLLEMWTRFLFSALVDADRLATEAFDNPEQSAKRTGPEASISVLRDRLEAHLQALERKLTPEAKTRPVCKARHDIAEACKRMAHEAPGLFSLTVPTGGGKTLAGMRFALQHAAIHGKRRVVVAIPYTSIIEQSARVYREALGAANVLEHHSNLDVDGRVKELGRPAADRQDLATENWDAPVIVTTNVQLLESLFSNHPSRCRKLHNIANSVIVFDEAQALPPEFLLAILDGLRQLVAQYGCTILLSTATQPALNKREALPAGLEGVREIVPDPAALARGLRRVRYEWPTRQPEPGDEDHAWEEIAESVATHDQVLAVTHKRQDARLLAETIRRRGDPEETLHLSALMCPAHRLSVLAKARERLREGLPCRLISTQLIEAGVDIDFPVVYRAMGGLDSIVQAGGRCNREGKLDEGRVVVFHAPTKPPPGLPTAGLAVTQGMLSASAELDPSSPEVQEEYFRRLYFGAQLDAKSIQMNRKELNFAAVGRDFRLIEDAFTHPIVIPWRDGSERIADLQGALAHGPSGKRMRDYYRAIQPFIVSVYEKSFRQALAGGALIELADGLHMLLESHMNHYSEDYGLVIGDDIALADVASTIL